MNDLFAPLDEDKRRRLKALGWTDAGKSLTGVTMWRSPIDNALRIEKEAFAWLDRQAAQEAKARGQA